MTKIVQSVNNNKINLEQLTTDELLQLTQQLTQKEKYKLARENYALFLELILQNETPPYKHSRHTQLICDKLKEVYEGKCKRLIVCMPCRHSKSHTISRYFTAWYFANNPEKNVIIASYGSQLSNSEFSMPAREMVERYGKDIFNVQLDPKKKSLDHWKLKGHKGSFYSVGVGSGTIGKGFNLAVIDDPVKGWEEATSPTVKEKIYNWYKTVFRTRATPMSEGGAIILILTRWAEDDLAGRLLKDAEEGDGEHWDTLVLKAICDNKEEDPLHREIGESLWPERYPLPELIALKNTLGLIKFEALYQQTPSPAKGYLFHEDWLRYYTDEDITFNPHDNTYYFKGNDPIVTRYAACDPSVGVKTINDPSVIIVADITRSKNILVRKIFRKRINIPSQIRLLIDINNIWKPNKFFIEVVGYQEAAKQMAQDLDINNFIPFVSIKRGGRGKSGASKELRISEMSPFFESNKVWFMRGTEDTREFIEEYTIYPSGPHDDQLDTIEQIISEVRNLPAFDSKGTLGQGGGIYGSSYKNATETPDPSDCETFDYYNYNTSDDIRKYRYMNNDDNIIINRFDYFGDSGSFDF